MANKPVALVTGANQGIGLQIAKDLAHTGSLCWSGREISSAERLRPRRSTETPARSSST